jgi:hypothetical protein
VVYDPRETDPARRFKGFAWVDLALRPVASPDGKVWAPLAADAIPTQDEYNLSYDAAGQRFLATVKHKGPFGRSVYLSTSPDFLRWSKPELIFHADEEDQQRGRETIRRRFADPALWRPLYNDPADYNVDVYNMGIFRYEGLYVGLPAMYHATGKLPTVNTDGFHLVQLACSRDLKTWQRLGGRQPFLGPSPLGAGAFDLAEILPPSFPVVRDNELWFYYTGIKYREPPRDAEADQGGICLAVLRRDGFVSLDAGAEEGWVQTRPFVLPKGALHLNAQAPGGRVAVEVCDEGGQTLADFGPSQPVSGDQFDAVVRWPAGGLEKLAGREVRLRFKLTQARLYSYWVE